MTGFISVIPQMFVPIAAQLSSPKDRLVNIALVMSGLLIGILLPDVEATFKGSYIKLLRSMLDLFWKNGSLRLAIANSSIIF